MQLKLIKIKSLTNCLDIAGRGKEPRSSLQPMKMSIFNIMCVILVLTVTWTSAGPNIDVFGGWKTHASALPSFARLARCVLALQSSSSSKRNFSATGLEERIKDMISRCHPVSTQYRMNKKRLVDWIAYFLLWTLSFYLVFLNQENGHRLFILTNQESNGYFKFGFLVVIEKAFCPGIFYLQFLMWVKLFFLPFGL